MSTPYTSLPSPPLFGSPPSLSRPLPPWPSLLVAADHRSRGHEPPLAQLLCPKAPPCSSSSPGRRNQAWRPPVIASPPSSPPPAAGPSSSIRANQSVPELAVCSNRIPVSSGSVSPLPHRRSPLLAPRATGVRSSCRRPWRRRG
ncbi:hypothetical protein D1007_07258 [Hordeum vulgare]|nr:hypothetical protein D1007_07258 [Hordeum vulgare]